MCWRAGLGWSVGVKESARQCAPLWLGAAGWAGQAHVSLEELEEGLWGGGCAWWVAGTQGLAA